MKITMQTTDPWKVINVEVETGEELPEPLSADPVTGAPPDTLYYLLGEISQTTWESDITYAEESVVLYNESIYVANTENINSQPNLSSYWDPVSEWSSDTTYEKGDYVYIEWKVFIADPVSVGDIPSEGLPWGFSNSQPIINEWQDQINYDIGDKVEFEGNVYKATGLSIEDPPPTGPWEITSAWDEWNEGTTYSKGKTVFYQGSLYTLIDVDVNEEPPGDSWMDPSMWEVSAFYRKGAVVMYENTTYILEPTTTNDKPPHRNWVFNNEFDIDINNSGVGSLKILPRFMGTVCRDADPDATPPVEGGLYNSYIWEITRITDTTSQTI